MRSLLARWSAEALLAALGIVAYPGTAAARQAAMAKSGLSPSPGAAIRAIAANRTDEARAILQSATAREVAPDRRAAFRLQAAQSFLFDGRYADAVTAYAAVLESGDARGIDTLTAWAHHGMAIAEAFAGNTARARGHYDEMLRVPSPSSLAVADTIEAYVLTGRRAAGNRLLDEFAGTHRALLSRQYVQSFRALSLLLAGNCGDAIPEVWQAPDPGRPLPQAIRGVCAAKAGKRAEGLALRDSVLTQPLADPLSWPMIVARGLALRIH